MIALCVSFSQALVPNSRPAVSSRRAALGDVSRFALGVAALAAAPLAAPLAARADEDVPMSKAKAKIVAAKAIADAKVAERGYANPEAKETKGISMKVKDDVKLSKEQKLMAEAGQQGQKWPRSQQPARPVTAP